MTKVQELIEQGLRDFSSAKLADTDAVVNLLLDIRSAIKESDDGQEDNQTEAEGSRIPEPV